MGRFEIGYLNDKEEELTLERATLREVDQGLGGWRERNGLLTSLMTMYIMVLGTRSRCVL